MYRRDVGSSVTVEVSVGDAPEYEVPVDLETHVLREEGTQVSSLFPIELHIFPRTGSYRLCNVSVD